MNMNQPNSGNFGQWQGQQGQGYYSGQGQSQGQGGYYSENGMLYNYNPNYNHYMPRPRGGFTNRLNQYQLQPQPYLMNMRGPRPRFYTSPIPVPAYNYYENNNNIPRSPVLPNRRQDPTPPEGCNCDRPRKTIYCLDCEIVKEGFRVRKKCPAHPNRITLSDLTQCPECRSPCVTEPES